MTAYVIHLFAPLAHHLCRWTMTKVTLWGHTSIEWTRTCGHSSYTF